MTMFSFGMIKHNTAFYGAVTIVREDANVANVPEAQHLYERMAEIQDTYREYTVAEYSKKIKTTFAIWSATSHSPVINVSFKLFKMSGVDVEDYFVSKLRGFATDEDDYLSKFRI